MCVPRQALANLSQSVAGEHDEPDGRRNLALRPNGDGVNFLEEFDHSELMGGRSCSGEQFVGVFLVARSAPHSQRQSEVVVAPGSPSGSAHAPVEFESRVVMFDCACGVSSRLGEETEVALHSPQEGVGTDDDAESISQLGFHPGGEHRSAVAVVEWQGGLGEQGQVPPTGESVEQGIEVRKSLLELARRRLEVTGLTTNMGGEDVAPGTGVAVTQPLRMTG